MYVSTHEIKCSTLPSPLPLPGTTRYTLPLPLPLRGFVTLKVKDLTLFLASFLSERSFLLTNHAISSAVVEDDLF
jgi:hypothetical protein